MCLRLAGVERGEDAVRNFIDHRAHGGVERQGHGRAHLFGIHHHFLFNLCNAEDKGEIDALANCKRYATALVGLKVVVDNRDHVIANGD